jgi:hypothetical protein
MTADDVEMLRLLRRRTHGGVDSLERIVGETGGEELGFVIRGVKTAQEDAESDEELQGFPEERTEDHR